MNKIKSAACFIFIFFLLTFPVVGKRYEQDSGEIGRGGHLGDIIRLFLGDAGETRPSWERLQLNNEQNEVFEVITTSVQLAFDLSANNLSGANNYRTWLEERRNKYKLKRIPEVETFIAPASSSEHEWYTHLGWGHDYGEGKNAQPNWGQKKWLTGRKLFLDTLDSLFDFSIFSKAKLNSFGALIYYVHILGDHEENEISNAYTRIPVSSMDEHDGVTGWNGWHTDNQNKEKEKNGRPQSTIVDDLKIHLEVLFKDIKNQQRVYTNLMTGLDDIYGRTVSEKAKKLQSLLFLQCPILLREAGFSANFYAKYGLNN